MTEDIKPINNYEDAALPVNPYKRLFIAITETRGYPTLDDLKGIVEIVLADFKPENKTNY